MRLILLGLLLTFAAPVIAEEAPAITVTGRGEIAVVPDMARVRVGVTHEAKTARAAMDAFNADLAQVLARLESTGIAPEDMQTSGLSLRPVQDYRASSGAPRITGYIASSDVTVDVRMLADLPKLLDALVSDGATNLGGLQFDVADRAPHLAAARRAAVADAASKAGVFADAAGLSLGAVLMMQESGGAAPRPMMEMRTMAADAGVPIAAGDITINAQITIRYGLE